MKILMLQSIAGHAVPRYGLADFGFAPGSVIEIDDELAQAWVDAGIAKAAKKGQELTVPVEVYSWAASSQGIAEAKAKAEAEAKGATD